jgi:hypothetical protein
MGLPSTISRSVGKGHGKPKAENTPFSSSPAIGAASLIRHSLYLSLIPFEMAHDVGEAATLIEAGFEYVTGEYGDGGKLFKKRK